MAKTLLKMVLGVLLLSGLFFFMLQLWEKNRSDKSIIVPAQQEAPVGIQEILVSDVSEGATVEIKNITGSTYSISKDTNGLAVDFPDLKVTMVNKTITLPHPLVESIEASDTGAEGQNGASVRLNLVESTSFTTRQSNGSLFIDIVKIQEAPVVTPTPEPVKKSITTKKKSKKPTPKKSAKRSTVRKRQQDSFFDEAPKPAKKASKKAAAKTEEDEFLAQLGISDTPPTEDLSQVPEVPDAQLPQEGESNDLLAAVPDLNAPGAGTAPLEKNFDSSQVTANMPQVTALKVDVEAGITKVRIMRGAKTKYKIFPKRNPNRVVIEFQNAVNQLPSEMGGFPGSRVDRVVTSQFVGPEGTISRIELFLNNVPEINRSAVVNSASMFELPIP